MSSSALHLAPLNSTCLETEKLRTWLLLLRRVGGLKKSVDAYLNESFDVSLSRFDVLSALERGGKKGLKAGELTKMLVVSDGNTTQVTNKLVRDGLVERRNGKQDRRCVIYALTESGKVLFEEMANSNRMLVSNIFTGFNSEDLSSLKELLAQLNVNDPKKKQEGI